MGKVWENSGGSGVKLLSVSSPALHSLPLRACTECQARGLLSTKTSQLGVTLEPLGLLSTAAVSQVTELGVCT